MKLWSELADEGTLRPARILRDGQWVVRSPEPVSAVHFLSSGIVELSQELQEGGSVVFQLLRGPAILAVEEGLAGLSEHETSIRAVRECAVHRIELSDFRELLTRSSCLSREVLAHACQGKVAAARFARVSMLETEALLANLLLAYVECFGTEGPEGWRIHLRRSQNDLAARVGAAERSVNRALTAWQRSGVLSRVEGEYVIHQVDYLHRVAHDLRGSLSCVSSSRIRAPSLPVPSRRDNWMT